MIRQLNPEWKHKDCNLPNTEQLQIESIKTILCQKKNKNLLAWSELGNTKTRRAEQSRKAQEIANNFLSHTGRDVIVFTDGSALGNPGPCGSGVAVYWDGPNSTPTTHRKPVSSNSSSYHGEIEAIPLGLATIVAHRPSLINRRIHLLSRDYSGKYFHVPGWHISSENNGPFFPNIWFNHTVTGSKGHTCSSNNGSISIFTCHLPKGTP